MNEALFENARRAHALGQFSEAARLYAEILRANARNFDALYGLGVLYYDRGAFEDARRLLSEAVRLNPRSSDAHFAHGCALQRMNRNALALAAFDEVLALESHRADAMLARANALLALRRWPDAVEAYDRHLAAKPDSGEAWHNRGTALSELKRFEEAEASFGEAIALRPESAASWNNRGHAHSELKDYEAAIRDYGQALAIDPDLAYARGNLILAKLAACDWQGLEQERAKLASALRAGKAAIVPFGNVMISDSPADQMTSARVWVTRYATPREPLWHGQRYDHARIRVAYVSGDFRAHPVALLMAGVFEHHDRNRFETIGVSFGPDDKSELRARVAAAFEHFIDARVKSDFEIACTLREMEVDIAVDLTGLTEDCRTGIFAFRPAPAQVNYLGYPGTMAVRFMDYIIADRVVIPENQQHHYSEKIAYLPDTYLPSDDKRAIAARTPTRPEAGLPEQGFVFCSFNTSYKFTPEIFAVWMRILSAVEGSLLWLSDAGAAMRRNLALEAQARGIDVRRIVFAAHVPAAEDHLARLKLADLFLDTLPCNAHTTASDALWAGVPVLTCKGSTFAGRVAASLLHAAGLPELITESLAGYEELAVLLARDCAALSAVKAKLARNRQTMPLFDTARFTRNLESAFSEMRRQAARGRAPQSFAVGQGAP